MTVRSSAEPIDSVVGAPIAAGSRDLQTARQRGSAAAARLSHERPSFGRVLDLALYAPVGAALVLREELPKRARQRRQALENRVQLARFIGRLAVQTGQRELAKRIAEQQRAKQAEVAASREGAPNAAATTDDRTPTHPVLSLVPSAGVRSAAPDEPDEPDAADAAERADVPAADRLPIRDYESLAAIHVVERLRSMDPGEIESIRRFEVAHRSRRTILAKIEQLQQR